MNSFIRLGALFSLMISLATGSGCESDSKKKLGDGHDFGDNNPDLVLAMGDSITAGGYSGGSPWPARFGGMVGKSVINDGIPGASSPVGAGRINSLLATYKPGFVIIWYGANDAINGYNIETTDGALRYIVDAAKANNSIPVIANVMPMAGGRVIYNGNVERINERIANISGVKKVNVYKMVSGNTDLYLADGLHLSDAGEQEVAALFMDAFN